MQMSFSLDHVRVVFLAEMFLLIYSAFHLIQSDFSIESFKNWNDF